VSAVEEQIDGRVRFRDGAAYLVAFGSLTGAQAQGSRSSAARHGNLAKLGRIDLQRAGITAAVTTDGKVSGFSGCNSLACSSPAHGPRKRYRCE
jgi:heat shock protein HslJ